MENKIITKVDFTIEELEESYFECTFEKCNFSGLQIGRVMFEECKFNECNLSLVKAKNTSWQNVLFIGCKMTGIDFSTSNRFGITLKFQNCILSYALFTEMKLKGIHFAQCDLQSTDFMETDLSESVFTECDLAYASFHRTNLEKADLTTAHNYAINPTDNRLKKAKFSRFGVEGLLAGTGVEIID